MFGTNMSEESKTLEKGKDSEERMIDESLNNCNNQAEELKRKEFGADEKANDVDMIGEEESDSELSNKETCKEDEKIADLSVEERLTRAASCKEHGNNLVKESKSEEARDVYKNGIDFLKDLEDEQIGDIKAKSVKQSLNLNLSLCYIRLGEWLNAINSASYVIKSIQDSMNSMNNNNSVDLKNNKNSEMININDSKHPLTQIYIKALYRRGYARSQFGLWEEAKLDLQEVLKIDDSSADAKREIINVVSKIKNHAEKNKKAFGGIFEKTSKSLYSDREEELKRRKEADEAERKKLREEWHSEMNQRKEYEEEINFEEWLEERKKKEKEKEKEKEENKKEENKKKELESKNHISSKSKSSTAEELDEEDERIVNEIKKMGYCYFRRELTTEEKHLNMMNKPKKLNDLNSINSEKSTSKEGGVSKWNAKGTTYEEKDCTQWAKNNITQHMIPSSVSTNMEKLLKSPEKFLELFNKFTPNMSEYNAENANALASIASKLHRIEISAKSIKDISGDAHIAVIRGTKRYIFDFNLVVTFECTVDSSLPFPLCPDNNENISEKTQGNEKKPMSTYKGELHLSEISSTTDSPDSWIKDMNIKYDKEPKVEHKYGIEELMNDFKKLLVSKLKLFMKDFHESF